KTQCDRITGGGKDDGYGRGRCLRRQRRGGVGGYEYRYAEADEIGCKRRQTIVLIFRPAVFDPHVLAPELAGFLRAPEKRNGPVRVNIGEFGTEPPNPRHGGLLPPRHQRQRRRAPEPRDKLPPSDHSITSSAVSRIDCGTVSPSALAVLRFTTIS